MLRFDQAEQYSLAQYSTPRNGKTLNLACAAKYGHLSENAQNNSHLKTSQKSASSVTETTSGNMLKYLIYSTNLQIF